MAIAEQISEPGKGLVEREVRRVVTKGTVVEPGMLDERRNNYLVAVAMAPRGRRRPAWPTATSPPASLPPPRSPAHRRRRWSSAWARN